MSGSTEQGNGAVEQIIAQALWAAQTGLCADIQIVRPVHVTFFRDFAAKRYTTENLTLEQLGVRVLDASAHKKEKLRWLKLAKFGRRTTDKGCLRNDANVEMITGCELDYDKEQVSFDDALRAVQAMRIHALLYTSPSHSPAAPRWRILAPTSKPLPPEMRGKLAARLNGSLKASFGIDVVAAYESFTLSQAYYFGWVINKPALDHHAEVIAGDFIDERDDLEIFEATGGASKKGEAAGSKQAPRDDDQVHGFGAILAQMGDGDGRLGFNGPLSRAAASYVATYYQFLDEKKLKKILRDAIDQAPKKVTPERVESIKGYKSDKYLSDIISSAIRKYTESLPVTTEHFVADMEAHNYIFLPTRQSWPGSSVNARIRPVGLLDNDGRPMLDSKKKPKKIPASVWLDRYQPIEAVTWWPGDETVIKDRLFIKGGWIDHPGARALNLYRPPSIVLGDPNDVTPWRDHLCKIYPDDAEHIERFMAHRVQHPEVKVNHALFLGGEPGIGKDTLLEPLKRAVGPWNVEEVTPQKIAGSQFNGYLKCVVLRISEAHDLGDINRFAFYEMTKTVIAGPPYEHRINEKFRGEYYIPSVNSVIMTANYLSNGIYLPPDDRRHYIAWSNCKQQDFKAAYWNKLWKWLDSGGDRNVAAYLATMDLSEFDAKATPRKTDAFWQIVNSNAAPEEVELAELLENLGNPDAVTIVQLANESAGISHLQDFHDWIKDRKNRRAIPHRMGQVGYVPVRNSSDKSGMWKILGAKPAVYAKKELPINAQIKAVRKLIAGVETKAARGHAQPQPEANPDGKPQQQDEKLDFGRARPQKGQWWNKD